MSKYLKVLLIVLSLSLLSSVLTVLLYLTDPEFKADFYTVFSMVLVTVWVFFLMPSFPLSLGWVKRYFADLSAERAFRLGYLFGTGWGVIAALMILIASPVSGSIWMIRMAKAARQEVEMKRASENPTGEKRYSIYKK